MSKSETMTLTKALVELKLLKKRVEKKVMGLDPVAMKKGAKFESAIKSQQEFERHVKAEWQSIHDLMARRRKIKTALVMANASTQVKIAGEIMTIAEAIERKTSLDNEEDFRKTMHQKLVLVQLQVDNHNRDLEGQLIKLLESTYARRETQISKDDFEHVAKPFRESNEAKLVDPIDLGKNLQKMEEEAEKFLAEVDVCLSIANATNTITIT